MCSHSKSQAHVLTGLGELSIYVESDMNFMPMNVTPPSDEQLVLAVRSGDARALDVLLRRYLARAERVAMRLLSHRADAEEAVQEASIRAMRSLHSLKEPARFGSWLMRIVANVSLNQRRSRRHKLHRIWSLDHPDNDSGQPMGQNVPAPGHLPIHPEAQAMAKELDQKIQTQLAQLSAKQRNALLLFSVEGRSQREVAEMLGCSVEAVKWHVFEARRKLRSALNGELRQPTDG